MLLLLNHEYDITLDHVRLLFSILLKYNLIPILHASFNFDIELFTLLYESLSFACLTEHGRYSSLASTLLAGLLHLHLHDTHVYSLHGNTSTFAGRAFFSFTTFRSGAFALAAVDVSINVERILSTVVEFFQFD